MRETLHVLKLRRSGLNISGSGLKKSESRCKWNTNEWECVGVHESE